MATGALDANGIWIYGEDDSEATFSVLLNKLGDSVSDTVTDLKAWTGIKAIPGYVKLKNGFIIQWGVTPDGASNTNIGFTFPIAFPNAILGAVGITRAGASFGKGANLDGFTNTYVSMSHNAGATTNIRVIVIGY